MRWKDVPGYEGLYEVSSNGDVRSRDRVVNAAIGAKAVRKGRILKQVAKANGYLCVTLTRPGVREQFFVHRLVLLAFRGVTTSYYLHTRHRDGARTNNALANIWFGTPKENNEDQRLHGTRAFGETHPRAILIEAQARKIKDALTGTEARALAVRFGVGPAQAYSIRSGRSWGHLK